MGKTIYDIMSDDRRLVGDYFVALNELVRTRYILAEKKIVGVMKLAVSSRMLYEFYGRVLKDFDYATEVKRCTIDDGGRVRLLLPVDKKRATALVFCLLIDIDNQNIYLNDFLRSFFYGDTDINSAYETFCREVITPFIENSRVMLEEGLPESETPATEKRDSARLISVVSDYIGGEEGMTEPQKERLILAFDKIGANIREGHNKTALALFAEVREELIYFEMSAAAAEAMRDLQYMLMN